MMPVALWIVAGLAAGGVVAGLWCCLHRGKDEREERAMREILFRGKRKDTGEWVEGDLVRLKDGTKAIPHIYGYGEVIPDTVGQFTGLTDKNGKKIFEGDIVLIDGSDIGHVEYTEKYAMFEGVFGEFREDFQWFITQYPDVIIIGNIYDNPELLEGDRDG